MLLMEKLVKLKPYIVGIEEPMGLSRIVKEKQKISYKKVDDSLYL